MNHRQCPVCNNPAPERLKKGAIPYFQCGSCKTLFCDPLDNSNMVGGGNEEARNKEQNPERIYRFERMFQRKEINVLDFGCGNGMLVNDLKSACFNADGYDAYNPLYSKLPQKDKYELVVAVEVVEHLSKPFIEFDCIYRSLKVGGVLYIETSFVDVAIEEQMPLEEFFYVSPEVGHSTIFSHHGLDLLLSFKGFIPFTHINRHVRCYRKK